MYPTEPEPFDHWKNGEELEHSPQGQIIVYQKPLSVDPIRVDRSSAVAVVDSQSPELLAHLPSTGLLAVTCGLSARDTVTLSSIGADSAVITLQRSIACFDGSTAEPQEFPVSFSGSMDCFLLMATAASLILGGHSDRLCQAKFAPVSRMEK